MQLPRIAVSPTALTYSLPQNATRTDSLRLENTGGANLAWQASAEPAGRADLAWLRFASPAQGLLAPGEWGYLRFEVDTGALPLGAQAGKIAVTSNDPIAPRVEIPLNLSVTDPATGGQSSALGQNHPNPFSPGTTISFSLQRGEAVTLEIFDGQGRLVRRLLAGEALGAGAHAVPWDGRDGAGAPLASGLYFATLRTAAETLTRKMVRLR